MHWSARGSVKTLSRVWIGLFLAFLVVCGAYLRFYHLSDQPYWMDEGYTINAVLSVEEHGSTILDSGRGYSCTTYCYPTAFIAHTFGDNAFSYRLLAVIAGVFLIPLVFVIGYMFSNVWIGLGAALFTSFSYFQIAWSRQARWYTLFELFFWFALFSFYQTLYAKSQRWLWIILTAGFTLLSVATHGLGYLLPFIFFGWFVIDRWIIQKHFSWKEFLGSIVLLMLVAGSFQYFKLLPHVHLYYELPYYLSFYLRSYWLLIIFALIPLVLEKSSHKRELWFLSFAILAYLLPLSFFTGIVHYRYLFHLTPALFLLASFGLIEICQKISKQYFKIGAVFFVLALFFVLGEGVPKPSPQYFLESDDPSSLSSRPYYAYTPQPDWNAAYEYVQEHRQAGDVVVSSMPQFNKIFLHQPGYWIAYDYLGFDTPSDDVVNGKEIYVNAIALQTLADVKTLTTTHHGCIILDLMAISDRIPADIVVYIQQNMSQVFHEQTNSYSEIWVYRF